MKNLGRGTITALALVAIFASSSTSSAAGNKKWVAVATAEDCGGTDVACTMNGATPDPGLCNPHFKGQTAVCWDGGTYKGTTECFGRDAWCTYKTTPAKNCTGGGNKGIVYECR